MLTLPSEDATGEERRIPFDKWGRMAFVRSWRELGHGLFLIDFTNAKNGKSRSWKYAVVKQGFRHSWDDSLRRYSDNPNEPAWIEVARVARGVVQNEEGFNVLVYPQGFETMDWYWPKSAKVWHSDREEACRLMLGFTEVLYGISFDGDAVSQRG